MPEIANKHLKDLAQIGIGASLSSMPQHAIKILTAVDQWLECDANARTALAVAHLNNADIATAIRMLRSLSESHSQHTLSQCFLGLALKIQGANTEASRILTTLSHSHASEPSGKFAKMILDTRADDLPTI